ncbi:MAG: hypothetical protein Kow0090_18250 [Myxococcota bacterium]
MKITSKRYLIAIAGIFALVLMLLTVALLSLSPEDGVSLGETASAEDTFYTCPMHPIIVQEKPGTCPICGMELVEKKAQSAADVIPKVCGDEQDDEDCETQTEKEGGEKILYSCGMHPNVIQDKPGNCPICGMELTPMKKSGGKKRVGGGMTVEIDPVMVQNMGVRVEHIKREAIFRHIRTIGEIDVAEDEISLVNLRFSGWIERVWADETWKPVSKGDRLFEIYSPEVLTAQEEYLLALGAGGAGSKLAESAAKRLLLWEIPQSFLKEIAKEGNARRTITVRAPRDGYILHKNILEGAYVRAGTDLYRIGNLKKIWVNAEVYEYDAPWIEVGQKATMELSYQQGKVWEGKIAYIYPTVNRKSRTLSVRLEFPNPGVRLKPGMFATVRIEVEKKENIIAVPTEAIIHSGERRIVFVAKGGGKYEMKEIVTGLYGDNRKTEVLSGLNEDDAVVISGQFLLDSESQLQEAVQKMLSERLESKSNSHPAMSPQHQH